MTVLKFNVIAAVALLLSAIASAPARADDLADADAAFAAGEAERAERLYARLAGAGSNVARVHRNLAVLYDDARRGGDFVDRAEALYRRAIALDPKDAAAQYRFGLHLYARGKGEEAVAALRAAHRLDPAHADASYWLARVLEGRNEGTPAEREALYRSAIRSDPGHSNAHFYLSRLLANAGRKAEAVAVLKQGRELKPRPGHKQPDDFAEELKDLAD